MIYLDYAANTPVDKEVLDAYYDTTLEYYGNPNSLHKFGQSSKDLIDEATDRIAKLLKVEKDEIIYTSGATECNNMAVKGICERYKKYGNHILVSCLEHSSILSSAATMEQMGFVVELIPVTEEGKIDINALKKLLRKETILVSVTSLDSELGLVQPIEEIAELLKERPHTFFHTDASQSMGKVDIDYTDVDLITIAPHKFYGINDIGILVKKDGVSLRPQITGGRSTTVYRSGTPNTASIVAAAVALSKALKERKKRYKYVSNISKNVQKFLNEYDNVHINNLENSVPFTINFSVKGVSSGRVVELLDKYDICVTSKTSGSPTEQPSKLVYALTKDKSLATSSIRISLSHLTTLKEIEEFEETFDKVLKEIMEEKYES